MFTASSEISTTAVGAGTAAAGVLDDTGTAGGAAAAGEDTTGTGAARTAG